MKTEKEFCYFCEKPLTEKEYKFHKECANEILEFNKKEYLPTRKVEEARFFLMLIVAKERSKQPLEDIENEFLSYCKEKEIYSEIYSQFIFMNMKYENSEFIFMNMKYGREN